MRKRKGLRQRAFWRKKEAYDSRTMLESVMKFPTE